MVTTGISERVANLSVSELEALIRRIVHDEVQSALAKLGLYEEPAVVEPDSPLYEDLMDIQQRAGEGGLEFHTYEEVFGGEQV